jgi:hypothetical protein
MTNIVKAANVKSPAARKFLLSNSTELLQRAGYTVDPNALTEIASNPAYHTVIAQHMYDPSRAQRDPQFAQSLLEAVSSLEKTDTAFQAYEMATNNYAKQQAEAAGVTGKLAVQDARTVAEKEKLAQQFTQNQALARLKGDVSVAEKSGVLASEAIGEAGTDAQASARAAIEANRKAQLAATGAKATGTTAQLMGAATGEKKAATQDKNVNSLVDYRKAQAANMVEQRRLEAERNQIMKKARESATGRGNTRTANTAVQQVFRNLEPTSKLIRQANTDLSLFRPGKPMTLFEATEALKGVQRLIKGPGVLTDSESTELRGLAIPKITQWERAFKSYTGNPLSTTVPDNVKEEIHSTLTRMQANQRKQFDAQGNADIDNRVAVKAFMPDVAEQIKKNLGITFGTPQGMVGSRTTAPVQGTTAARIATKTDIQALRGAGKFKTDAEIKAYIKSKGGNFNEGDFK